MSAVVVSHPRFAAAPVKNPPMKKGPKPKGTLSLSRARWQKEKNMRLLEKDRRAREAEPKKSPTFIQLFDQFLQILVTSDIAPETLARPRDCFFND